MAIAPPWCMVRSISRKAAALPDISRPTSKPSCMPRSFMVCIERLALHVDGARRAHAARQLQAVVVDVGDHDVARADEARDRGRHDADRAGAGDQHVLADQVEGQRGVGGVAERIEDRGDVVADRVGQLEGVVGGDRQVLGERPGTIDADADRVAAQVPPAGAAVAAVAAGDVALARDAVADLQPASPPSRARRCARSTRGRPPSAPGWSSAPSRPSCRCACRCRRSRSWRSRSARRWGPTCGSGMSSSQMPGAASCLTSAFMLQPSQSRRARGRRS